MRLTQTLSEPSMAREFFKQLFNNSPDPLFIADTELGIEESNTAFNQRFGKLDPRFPLSDLIKRTERMVEIQNRLHTFGRIDRMRVDFLNTDDETLYMELSLIPVLDEDNTLLAYQGIAHDITEQVIMNRKLGRAEKIGLTGRMVRVIAHEIRNPLTNISLALANLESSDIKEDDRFLLELIDNNADRINDLITELLDSSRPAEVELNEISLAELLADTLELAYDRMELQGIEYSMETFDEEYKVMADEPKIRLALNNIVINAVEAMPAGGKLELIARKGKRDIQISITDTGKGIPPEDINNLFDPFFTKKENGTGLGLTTVQNILEGHGWHIDVESEVAQGTTFYISIPLAS